MIRGFYNGEALRPAIQDFLDEIEERRYLRWGWLGYKPRYLWNGGWYD